MYKTFHSEKFLVILLFHSFLKYFLLSTVFHPEIKREFLLIFNKRLFFSLHLKVYVICIYLRSNPEMFKKIISSLFESLSFFNFV